MTAVRDGVTPSAVPAFTDIRANLVVSNYEATAGCVDTDDGSSWLRVERNFCVYGGHKSAFDGHAKLTVRGARVREKVRARVSHERMHARGGGGCVCACACACRRPRLFAPN